MKSVYFSSLLLSGLLLAACAKNETSPRDPLLGRWQITETVDTDYTASGQITQEKKTTYARGSSVEITATEFEFYTGSNLDSRTKYTRDDKILHFGTSSKPETYSTIKELTAYRLVLTNPRAGATGPDPATTSLVYSR